MEFEHQSVLLWECIEALQIKPDGIYVDGTLGGAGHSTQIAKRLGENGRLIGIDQDEAAITVAGERLAQFGDKVTIVRNNYCAMKEIAAEHAKEGLDGILLDLGVSSYQLDTVERGFSYRYDAPLDMRMDRRQTISARDIVNDYSEMELFRVIKEYGEEQFAKNIAKHIVNARKEKPIETTFELNELIKAAIPAKKRGIKANTAPIIPSTNAAVVKPVPPFGSSFLSVDFFDVLKPGGRLCIITFHSLEDRIVKMAMKKAENPCICPPSFPICTCGRVSEGRVITNKPILPGEEELEQNSRSKSAKLRVFEKRGE